MDSRTVPRALLVNHVGEISGAEKSMLTMVRHLDRTRIRPVAAVPAGPLARELEDLEVPVALVPELRLARPRNPWQMIARTVRLRVWAGKLVVAAEELGADLAAANSLTAGMAASMSLGRRMPVVWHARDLHAPERAVRWMTARATRIAAISTCVADRVIDSSRDAGRKTTLIYNGVDTVLFRPERPRQEVREGLGVPHDAILVGTVGQIVPWKRQDLFLEAAARILAHRPQAWFAIVGADLFGEHPEYGLELRRLARDLGLESRAVFTGYREDIASVMAAMDLLLHPAEDEPLGRAVMEAMSLGVPCVAADSCGPSEIIEDGVSGILVPPGDAEPMASRALELLRREGGPERMGEAAKRRIDGMFNAERMARLTEDLYEEALARGPR
ncbi:MAG: glycosyltransferase [Armatimonadota bacterium]|nr:glycosyltransferase [Armatimonadota bacterium]